jgi:hypothetical protein
MVRLAAAIAILAPIVYVRVVFGTPLGLRPCVGCYTDAQIAAVEQAVIFRGWIANASGVAWLVALLILAAATWRADRRRLVNVVKASAAVTLALETFGLVVNLERSPAMIATAVLGLGLVGLAMGTTVALAVASVTARPSAATVPAASP